MSLVVINCKMYNYFFITLNHARVVCKIYGALANIQKKLNKMKTSFFLETDCTVLL
jgi:hypothetical protein